MTKAPPLHRYAGNSHGTLRRRRQFCVRTDQPDFAQIRERRKPDVPLEALLKSAGTDTNLASKIGCRPTPFGMLLD